VKDSDKTDPFSDSETNRILDRQAGSNKVRLAVTVPDIGNVPDRFWGKSERIGDFGILGVLLPKVDVRVLFFDTNLEVVLDAWTHASVTSIFFGVAAAVLAVLGGFLALWWICRRPFTTFGKTTNPILCLVTTRRGVASLSQFQIMLWTFLVIASVAYVLALSGTLIPITTGTLVLLGISGGAAIIAKVKSESDATAALPRLDTATAAVEAERANDEAKKARAAADETPGDGEARSTVEEAEAKATAAKAKAEAVEAAVAAAKARTAVATAATDADKANAEAAARQAETEAETKRKAADEAAAKAAVITRVRRPRWSDLVMEEIKGRELDVTRVQMLYFTLLTASFVGVKVATSWEIPDIPEGYLILMGISNGVYVGSKLATKPGG
jgi:hypothetical protein